MEMLRCFAPSLLDTAAVSLDLESKADQPEAFLEVSWTGHASLWSPRSPSFSVCLMMIIDDN